MLECKSKTMLHGVDFSEADALFFATQPRVTGLGGVFLCKIRFRR